MTTWIPTTGVASRMRLDDIPVVDLDVHLLEDLTDLATFCDEPWRRVIVEGQPVSPLGGGYRATSPTSSSSRARARISPSRFRLSVIGKDAPRAPCHDRVAMTV